MRVKTAEIHKNLFHKFSWVMRICFPGANLGGLKLKVKMTDELLPYAKTVAENAIKVIFDDDSTVDRINLACGMLITVITWQQDRIKNASKDVNIPRLVAGKKVEALDPPP